MYRVGFFDVDNPYFEATVEMLAGDGFLMLGIANQVCVLQCVLQCLLQCVLQCVLQCALQETGL